MNYYGDFAEDATVYIPFNTFTSDDPQASSTITNLADADIKVHKDGGLTQIATDGATVVIDFDGITGNHLLTIDTSVHADYATGSDYQVRIEGTTVDAATINAFIGSFSIENRYQHGVAQTADNDTKISLIPTTAMRGTDSAATAANLAIVDTVVDGIQTDLSNGTDGLGAIKVAVDAIPTTAMRGTDSAATEAKQDIIDANVDSILVDTAVIGAAGAGLTALATQASVNTIDGIVDTILVDTADLQTNQSNWLTATGFATSGALATVDTVVDGIQTDLNNATDGLGAIKTSVDAIPTTAMRGTDSAALATALTTAQNDLDIITGADGVNLLSATQASIDNAETLITSVKIDTGTDIPARFTGIEGATFLTATDSLEALRDRGDAAWVTGAGGTPPQLLQSTTIATLASQVSFTLTAGSADNDAYNNAIAVITDSATAVQKAVGLVSDYVGATKTITLSADPAIFTMAVGDTIEIIAALGSAGSAPTVAQIRAEIDSNSTQLAAIVADTNELQSDDVPTLISNLDAVVDTVKAETVLILADTNELQTNQGNWLTATGFNTTTPLNAAGIRSAIGLASANIDTQLAGCVTATGFNTVAPLSAAGTRSAIGLASANMDTQFTASATATGFNVGKTGYSLAITPPTAAENRIEMDSNSVGFSALVSGQSVINDNVVVNGNAIGSLQDLSFSDIWTGVLTESYAADGAAMTPAQAFYMMWSDLRSPSQQGTTWSDYKIDGTTVSMTFGLDDALAPTKKTRAT